MSPGPLLRPVMFKRVADLAAGSLTLTSVVGNGGAMTFTSDGLIIATGALGVSNVIYCSYSVMVKLIGLPDAFDFQALFDQYKIVRARLRFTPMQNVSLGDPNANQVQSLMHYSVLDYDDNTLFPANNAGVQAMREYESFRQMNMFNGRDFVRTARPRVAVPVYQGATNPDAYTSHTSPWIDANYNQVEHYAFKGMFQVFVPNTSVQTFIWLRPELEVLLACRSVR